MEHFDVIIVGSGMSGIGAAYRLATKCPEKTFAILEARDTMGGTWDLWRYPGVRSDSDMYTFAYPFKVWNSDVTMASGGNIKEYLVSAAAECGADKHIHYGHRVQEAAFSTETGLWNVRTSKGAFTSSFVFLGSGYYEYDDGYNPEFKSRDRFKGKIINPIKWPQDLDYSDKRIVVIGSGATAISLVPELAKKAGHVTMLQRSPSYMYAAPNHQGYFHSFVRKFISVKLAAVTARWFHVIFAMYTYWACTTFPGIAKFALLKLVAMWTPKQDQKHFTPSYKPWDQRLCRVADGDLFEGINKGKISVATDHIDEFTEFGIRTKSGQELQADIIVSATGFNFMRNYPVGNIKVSVDGKEYSPPDTVAYKGCMLSNVPNLFYAIGYTNASWTLRTDMISLFMCKMFKHMDSKGFKQCYPPRPDSSVQLSHGVFGTLSSGYLVRNNANLPLKGDRMPWYAPQYYFLDKWMLLWRACEDGIMRFVK